MPKCKPRCLTWMSVGSELDGMWICPWSFVHCWELAAVRLSEGLLKCVGFPGEIFSIRVG
ncbi:MAG: hypothetical protein JWN70_5781 [Planctomycetaceae bacterium]|nr:hypothetical protein [Planctomycetaceae bacterium]